MSERLPAPVEVNAWDCCQSADITIAPAEECPKLPIARQALSAYDTCVELRDYYLQTGHDPLDQAAVQIYLRRHPKLAPLNSIAWHCAEQIRSRKCRLFVPFETEDGEIVLAAIARSAGAVEHGYLSFNLCETVSVNADYL